MSTSQQVLVLEAVVRLDAELAKVLGHVDVLSTSHGTHAVGGLRGVLDGVLSTIQDLRARVLAGTGETAIESAERVLRARSSIVVAQLDCLVEAETSVAATERVATERFRCVRDLRAFVLDRIGRVNAGWMRERRQSKHLEPSIDRRARDALYHVALDNAEYGFAAIGQERDVVVFLSAGVTSKSDQFRTACEIIAMALEVRNLAGEQCS